MGQPTALARLGSAFRASAAPAGHTYGPELSAQPDFASSTGLTFDHCFVDGSGLNFDGSGTPATCTINPSVSFSAGDVFRVETIGSNPVPPEDMKVTIGNGANVAGIPNGNHVSFVTMNFTGSGPIQVLNLDNNNPNGPVTFASVKKQLT